MRLKVPTVILFATIVFVGTLAAQPPTSTTFTYQGTLSGTNVNPNTIYEFQFLLFDEETGGGQLGPTITRGILLRNGVFIARLDFGNQFSGEPRYLEIRVKGPGEQIFTVLSPRQSVDWVPYSVRSSTSDNSGTVGGVPLSGLVQTNDPRLTDARQPLPGSVSYIQNDTNPQAANFNITGDGTAANLDVTSEYRMNGQRFLKASGTGISLGFDTLLPSEGSTSVGFGAGGGLPPGVVPAASTAATSVGYGAGGGNNGSFFGRLAGRRNTGAGNSFFGTETGLNNTGGQLNSFFGYRAGRATTNSNRNVFFGANAGQASTDGELNTLVGTDAGTSLVSGSQNTFLGAAAGNEIVTGDFNTFIGTAAGSPNGFENTMLGANAQCAPGAIGCNGVTLIGSLSRATNVNWNATAIGHRAQVQQDNSIVLGSINGINSATSDTNVGIGTTAPTQRLHVVGNSVLTGNLGVGTTSPTSKLHVIGNGLITGNLTVSGTITGAINLTPGSPNYIQNTTTQQATSNFNISGSGTASIFNAGSQFQIGGNRVLSIAGTENVFVARNAGQANTTGIWNTFIGFDSGLSNLGGSNNVFLGHSSGRSNVSGTGNTFLGVGAGSGNTTVGGLTFIGENAGASNTTGGGNVFVGAASGFANESGFDNTFLGVNSGANNVGGSSNTFVGMGSGAPNSSGSQNTFV
ncbi:MAG TPA: hypothetical protein DDW24_13685, partial [Blastocatellia bacterium]|nr:hypothetical protein [Blastocatellia bacterium]